jgi:hypothetical protein
MNQLIENTVMKPLGIHAISGYYMRLRGFSDSQPAEPAQKVPINRRGP